MAKERTPRAWLDARIAKVNKQKIDLARTLSIDNSRVHEMISGERKIKLSEMDRMAAFLGWTREELIRNETGAMVGPSDVATMEGVELDYAQRFDLPVYGADDSGGGAFTMTPRPVGSIGRSPALKGNKDAYAVYCAEDSLAPRYERGQTLVIDPTRPVAPRDDILLINKDGTSRCIRRLVEVLDGEWRVRQLTPLKTYRLSKADWPTAHKIFGSRTL